MKFYIKREIKLFYLNKKIKNRKRFNYSIE